MHLQLASRHHRFLGSGRQWSRGWLRVARCDCVLGDVDGVPSRRRVRRLDAHDETLPSQFSAARGPIREHERPRAPCRIHRTIFCLYCPAHAAGSSLDSGVHWVLHRLDMPVEMGGLGLRRGCDDNRHHPWSSRAATLHRITRTPTCRCHVGRRPRIGLRQLGR